MATENKITDITGLLDKLETLAEDDERVSLHEVLHALGRRSFAPWLLLTGLITLSPIGDIPTVPSMIAVVVLLISAQLLVRRRHFWLPKWLLTRSISTANLQKALRFLRRPARFIDRLLRPRLEIFTGDYGAYAIAVLCLMIGLGMPPMDFVPFTATGAGIALTGFGLALIAHDGLVALIAFAFTAVTYGFLIYHLFIG